MFLGMSVCPRDSLHFPLGIRQERYFKTLVLKDSQGHEVLSLLVTEPVPPLHPFSCVSGSEFLPPPPPVATIPTPTSCSHLPHPHLYVSLLESLDQEPTQSCCCCGLGAPRGLLTWKPSVVTTWGAGGFLGISVKTAGDGHDFTTQHHTQPCSKQAQAFFLCSWRNPVGTRSLPLSCLLRHLRKCSTKPKFCLLSLNMASTK